MSDAAPSGGLTVEMWVQMLLLIVWVAVMAFVGNEKIERVSGLLL